MDTTEIIHNALEWANKRLELQGEPITENQRNYIVFALRQELIIPVVVRQSEQCCSSPEGFYLGTTYPNCNELIGTVNTE